MIYKLLLGLMLLIQPYCIQTQDKITDKTNVAEDDPAFSLRNNLWDMSVEKDSITAGNTKCRQGNKCGYHDGYEYSWCYTDDAWGQCCTGDCKYEGSRMMCPSGNIKVACGSPGSRSITGKSCLSSHPCGHHSRGLADRMQYWCYVDEHKTKEFCCSPDYKCHTDGDIYGYWCYTSVTRGFMWQYCKL